MKLRQPRYILRQKVKLCYNNNIGYNNTIKDDVYYYCRDWCEACGSYFSDRVSIDEMIDKFYNQQSKIRVEFNIGRNILREYGIKNLLRELLGEKTNDDVVSVILEFIDWKNYKYLIKNK